MERKVTVQFQHPTIGSGRVVLNREDWLTILNAIDEATYDD